jgi:tripartite-type tricarboxylate transporter receptor subunit TctC
MNQAVNTILAKPDIRQKLSSLGYTPMGGTPQQLKDYMGTEITKWGEVVAFSGAKVD